MLYTTFFMQALATHRMFSGATVDPEELLASIGPGNVHEPLLRVIGHCVGAGYADWAIQRLVAPHLEKGNEARTAGIVRAPRLTVFRSMMAPCSGGITDPPRIAMMSPAAPSFASSPTPLSAIP